MLLQVAGAHVMVLAKDHPTQAREVAFDPVGVRATIRVDLAMVHAVHILSAVQHVPVRRFIRRHSGHAVNVNRRQRLRLLT